MNMKCLREPAPLKPSSTKDWVRFKRDFNQFILDSDMLSRHETFRVRIFFEVIGEEAMQTFNCKQKFDFKTAKLADVYKKIGESVAERDKSKEKRIALRRIVQKPRQNFDDFLAELQRALEGCDLDDEEKEIKNRIVAGIRLKSTQEKLLSAPDATLDEVIGVCKYDEERMERRRAERSHKGKRLNQILQMKRQQRDEHNRAELELYNKQGLYVYSGHRHPTLVPLPTQPTTAPKKPAEPTPKKPSPIDKEDYPCFNQPSCTKFNPFCPRHGSMKLYQPGLEERNGIPVYNTEKEKVIEEILDKFPFEPLLQATEQKLSIH